MFRQNYDHYVTIYDSSVQLYASLRALELPVESKTCVRFFSQLFDVKSLTLIAVEKEANRKSSPVDGLSILALDEYIHVDAKQCIINKGPLGKSNIADLARQFRLIWLLCESQGNGSLEIVSGKKLNSIFSTSLRSAFVQLFVKYIVLQRVFPAEQIEVLRDLKSYDQKCINEDDIASILQYEFRDIYDLDSLIRLKNIASLQHESSVLDIVHGTTQLIAKDRQMTNWLRYISGLEIPAMLKDVMFFNDAREVVWMQARSEARILKSVIRMAPRSGDNASDLWSDIKRYYQSKPGTFWYPVNACDTKSNMEAILREFRILQGWKHNKELAKHAKIVDIQQRSAERNVWIQSRFSKHGRKLVARDAILVDMANIFVNAYLSVSIIPSTTEDRRLLSCTDPSLKSPVNRYFHRLLATAVEIWTRLSDSTCAGVLDVWEEHQLMKGLKSPTLLTIAKSMPSSALSTAVDDNSSKRNLMPILKKSVMVNFNASTFRHLFSSSTSLYARPVSAIAVDALQHAKWLIVKENDSISMKPPNRRAFARFMLTSSQRRLSKLLTQQTLFYTDFNTTSPDESAVGWNETDDSDTQKEKSDGRYDAAITGPISLREKCSSLIIRSQLLAMRQVEMLLGKTMGTVCCHLSSMREVEKIWNQELLSSFPPLYTMWRKCTATYGFDVDNNNYGLPKTAAIIRDTLGVDTKSYRQKFTTSKNRSLAVDIISYLKYCFYLHCEPQDFHHTEFPMMLTTEVAHVIFYIRSHQPHLRLVPAATIPIIRLMRKSICKDGVYWLNWDMFSELIVPLFCQNDSKKKKISSLRNEISKRSIAVNGNPTSQNEQLASIVLDYFTLKEDGIVRMKSRARQQAVLIALNVQDITVPETNYRCMILALYDSSKHISPSDMPSTLLHKDDQIPKELIPHYMLSQFYDVRDLFMYTHSYCPNDPVYGAEMTTLIESGTTVATDGSAESRQVQKRKNLFASFGDSSLLRITPLQFVHGKLDTAKLTIGDIDAILEQHIWKNLTYLEIAKRLTSFGVSAAAAMVERTCLRQALEKNLEDIERRGAQYLREIISGVSQYSQF